MLKIARCDDYEDQERVTGVERVGYGCGVFLAWMWFVILTALMIAATRWLWLRA